MDKSIFVGQREVNDSVLLVAASSSWNVCPAPREEEKKLAASWIRKIDNLCQAGQRNQPSYSLPSKASMTTAMTVCIKKLRFGFRILEKEDQIFFGWS